MGKCYTLFPRREVKDEHGCLKDEGHNDAHVCRNSDGKLIEWEEDYECDCGCWDEWEDDGDAPCIIYSEVDKIK